MSASALNHVAQSFQHIIADVSKNGENLNALSASDAVLQSIPSMGEDDARRLVQLMDKVKDLTERELHANFDREVTEVTQEQFEKFAERVKDC